MKIFISFILLIIFTVIMFCGCGGSDGNNIVSVPDTASGNTENAGYGSIYVKVNWPEAKNAGTSVIYSGVGEKNDITASIPMGTKYIDIKVYKDEIDDTKLAAQHALPFPEDTYTFERIPTGKVIVVAECWTKEGGLSLSLNLDELDVKINAENNLNLELGEYNIEVTASPSSISPGEDTIITAEVSFEPTDIPHMVLENREIYFRIESGSGTFPGGTTTGKAITDAFGKCTITLTSDVDSEENIKVYVTFPFDATIDPFNELYLLDWTYCNITIENNLLWSDDFESYSPVPVWPSLWKKDANANDGSNNYVGNILSYDGINSTQALRLFGRTTTKWASLAHRALNPTNPVEGLIPPYEINIRIYNENQILSGHHNRARVAINSGTSWSTSNRTLIIFSDTNIMKGLDETIVLDSYSTNVWYSIKLKHTETELKYQIIEETTGKIIENTVDAPTGKYPYLTIEASGGGAWFDDVEIYSSGTKDRKVNLSADNNALNKTSQEIYDPDK